MRHSEKRSNLTDARSTSPPHEAAELINLNIPLRETPHEAQCNKCGNDFHNARSTRGNNVDYDTPSMSPLMKQRSNNQVHVDSRRPLMKQQCQQSRL